MTSTWPTGFDLRPGTWYRKMPRTAKPFWVLRPVCINKYAFGFRRTMEHLRAWPVVLPECVKKVEVSLSRRKERDPLSPHHGTRLFVYENLPQLKYHNPQLKVAIQRNTNANSQITFHSETGTSEGITTTGLRQKDIQNKIETFNQHLHVHRL